MITITSDNFDEQVLNNSKPVLVDFGAVWCGPCQMQSPIVDALDKERDDFDIGTIDIDKNPELAQKYNVLAVPTLMLFKNGEVVSNVPGLQSREQILETVEQFL